QGSQWKTSRYALAEDFARAQSAAKTGALSWMEVATDSVYGPQWTHPHPSFSADEKLVTFASDRTGHTQVYVAELRYCWVAAQGRASLRRDREGAGLRTVIRTLVGYWE